nr:integrase, catalytic region, zinc finger, CCHC-type, peptidase aspartic, catalytic [Tanacetum cinerariifolium]
VKENQEKDKIGSKPDKNRKRVKVGKSLKQLQWIKEEKPKKTQKEWSKTHTRYCQIQKRSDCKDNELWRLSDEKVTIYQFYYVEGLGTQPIFVGQFCYFDLEVAFRKHTCYICNLEGLMPNPPSLTPNEPPTNKDWDIMFQPMFDEYFNPPLSLASLIPVVVALVPTDSSGSPSSCLVDQDTPSPSTSQTPQDHNT